MRLLLKLTFKAYDHVNWHFLRYMMIKLGFAAEWINLIMVCMTTVDYSVSLNGYEVMSIHPFRGLRQLPFVSLPFHNFCKMFV